MQWSSLVSISLSLCTILNHQIIIYTTLQAFSASTSSLKVQTEVQESPVQPCDSVNGTLATAVYVATPFLTNPGSTSCVFSCGVF